MPVHQETRKLPYTAEQLYNLVMDIEKYPEFLPWCIAARINTRNEGFLEADVVAGVKLYREIFSSRVHFVPNESIQVEYMKGPMRHLYNKWQFKDVKGGCEVTFDLDFSMQAKLLEKIVNQLFYYALMRMIEAFEKRAEEVYPSSGP